MPGGTLVHIEFGSPASFLCVHIRGELGGVVLIVVGQRLGHVPVLLGSQAVGGAIGGLVPEHHVADVVGLGVVVDHQTLVVLGGVVHHGTKSV